MSVINIFSPGGLIAAGDGDHWETQFVASPWGTTAVWIQCTTKYVSGDGEHDFGIHEIFFLDDQGLFQIETFGDDSVYGTLRAHRFVPRLLGVTVAAHTFDGVIEGTVTLFQWG